MYARSPRTAAHPSASQRSKIRGAQAPVRRLLGKTWGGGGYYKSIDRAKIGLTPNPTRHSRRYAMSVGYK